MSYSRQSNNNGKRPRPSSANYSRSASLSTANKAPKIPHNVQPRTIKYESSFQTWVDCFNSSNPNLTRAKSPKPLSGPSGTTPPTIAHSSQPPHAISQQPTPHQHHLPSQRQTHPDPSLMSQRAAHQHHSTISSASPSSSSQGMPTNRSTQSPSSISTLGNLPQSTPLPASAVPEPNGATRSTFRGSASRNSPPSERVAPPSAQVSVMRERMMKAQNDLARKVQECRSLQKENERLQGSVKNLRAQNFHLQQKVVNSSQTHGQGPSNEELRVQLKEAQQYAEGLRTSQRFEEAQHAKHINELNRKLARKEGANDSAGEPDSEASTPATASSTPPPPEHAKHRAREAFHKQVVAFLEESGEDLLSLLRFRVETEDTTPRTVERSLDMESNPPPPTLTGDVLESSKDGDNSSRKNPLFSTPTRKLHTAHGPDAQVSAKRKRPGNNKAALQEFLSTLTPIANPDRFQNPVPSPFAFSTIRMERTNPHANALLSGLESGPTPHPGRNLGWHLAARLQRCIFRLLDGAATLHSLLSTLEGYFSGQSPAPISVQICAVRVVQSMIRGSPQGAKVVVENASVDVGGPWSNQAHDAEAGTVRETLESGRVVFADRDGGSGEDVASREKGATPDGTIELPASEPKSPPGMRTNSILHACCELLGATVSAVDGSVTIVDSMRECVMPVLNLLGTLAWRMRATGVSVDVLNAIVENGLLGHVLEALHTTSGDESPPWVHYFVECKILAMELLGVLVQKDSGSLLVEHIGDTQGKSRLELPCALYRDLLRPVPGDLASSGKDGVKARQVTLQFVLLRFFSSVTSQHGAQGVRWLLRLPKQKDEDVSRGVTGKQPTTLVSCTVRLLYTILCLEGQGPGSSSSGSQLHVADIELVRQALSLLMVLWPVYNEQVTPSMEDRHEFMNVLLAIRDKRLAGDLGDVAVLAAKMLRMM